MQLNHKFFAGFHHYILLADYESPLEWGSKMAMLASDGYQVHVERHTWWVSFANELEAVEFKLRYA